MKRSGLTSTPVCNPYGLVLPHPLLVGCLQEMSFHAPVLMHFRHWLTCFLRLWNKGAIEVGRRAAEKQLKVGRRATEKQDSATLMPPYLRRLGI